MSREERKLAKLRYYALCTFMDDLFGEILDKLQELSLLDNTIIVFVSDHGDMLGDRGDRYSKYCLYEGSVRVPLILSGSMVPDKLKGSIDHRPAELVDILPTLLHIAGVKPNPSLPGENLLKPSERIGNFSEVYNNGTQGYQQAPEIMWRKKDWKLILSIPGNVDTARLNISKYCGELYSLKQDPQEINNLYDNPKYFEIREQMTRELLLHLASSWAKWPWQPCKLKV